MSPTGHQFGADIKALGGIERVYSHNGTDPLHASNLPAWTAGVTALDLVDVVNVLDFGGDRTRALRELAARFGLNKADERKQVARLIFRAIKRRDTQQQIEASALAEGARLGLTLREILETAHWVAAQMREAA